MSCEIYIDDNAEEYDITVSGDNTCDEIDITVELEGETVSTETDPVFLAHPVYAVASGDVARLQTLTDANVTLLQSVAMGDVARLQTLTDDDVDRLQDITGANILDFHAPYSDKETASSIGTIIAGVAAAYPAAADIFPFVQAVGNTLKKITAANLRAQMQPSLTEYLYFAGAYTADAIGDWRMGAGASGFAVQYCSASGSSKGAGTWDNKLIIKFNE